MHAYTCAHDRAHAAKANTQKRVGANARANAVHGVYQVTAVTSYMLLDVRMPLLSALGYINTNVAILIYYS